jgi:hypothetical protein
MAGITGDRVSTSKRECGGSQIDAVHAVAGKEGSDPYYSMVPGIGRTYTKQHLALQPTLAAKPVK